MRFRTADKLRTAVNLGGPGEAERVLGEAAESEVEACWHATASPVERQEIASEITSLLEWARQAVLVGARMLRPELVPPDAAGRICAGQLGLAIIDFEV